MVYIRVEDSKDGFELCNKIIEIYYSGFYKDIDIDSLNGIFNLQNKIKSVINSFSKDDKLIIVYDNIIKNPLVSSNVDETLSFLSEENLADRVIWVPTISFELEVLTIIGIELICDGNEYNKWFRKLRDKYYEHNDISDMTEISKSDLMYAKIYDKVKKEKIKNAIYRRLNTEDFEKAITIESISKTIMSKVFVDGDMRPVKSCWVNNCCYKKSQCRYTKTLDLQKIKGEEQFGKHLYKIRALIHETAFYKLMCEINNILGVHEGEDEDIGFLDLICEEILEANYIHYINN